MTDEPQGKPPRKQPSRKPIAGRASAKKPPAKPKITKKGVPSRRGGRQLKADQQAAREMEIVQRRLLFPSWSWERIAVEVSKLAEGWQITGEGCHVAYDRWLEEKSADLAGSRGMTAQVVQEHIEGFRQLREMASVIALQASSGTYKRRDKKTGVLTEETMAPNHSNALGAITRVAELRAMEIQFLQEVGMMPRHLGVVKMEIEARAMVKTFMEVLHRHVPMKRRGVATQDLVEALRPSVTDGVLANQRELEPAAG